MQNVSSLLSEELNLVNSELNNIDLFNNELGKALKNFLTTSSKQIRSKVSLLYLKAFNTKVSANSIKIISAGEIIHNASLLQDDIIDNADTRRGETTIGTKYSKNISILSGDFLLSVAIKKLLSINNTRILDIFLECTQAMCKSEIEQYFLRGNEPELDNYINICIGKTAKLFEAILESCAISEDIDIKNAKQFALNFGIYFQLKNDLEKESSLADKKNKIYTPKDFLGIEKTLILIDNYQKKIRRDIDNLPDNSYKKGLEDLIIGL